MLCKLLPFVDKRQQAFSIIFVGSIEEEAVADLGNLTNTRHILGATFGDETRQLFVHDHEYVHPALMVADAAASTLVSWLPVRSKILLVTNFWVAAFAPKNVEAQEDDTSAKPSGPSADRSLNIIAMRWISSKYVGDSEHNYGPEYDAPAHKKARQQRGHGQVEHAASPQMFVDVQVIFAESLELFVALPVLIILRLEFLQFGNLNFCDNSDYNEVSQVVLVEEQVVDPVNDPCNH